MQHGIHFISGLPRSGSTLLAALLRQNPRFHSGMTSPVGSLYLALLSEMTARNDFSVFLDEKQRRALLSGLFTNYYADIAARQVVFDTNRLWCSKVTGLSQLFPRARVLCCVRHLSWIMDSIERLARRNAFQPMKLFDFDPSGTVYTRIDDLAHGRGMVGFAWNALKSACYSAEANRLILIQYESLTRAPEATLRAVYEALGEPWFAHDFDNVRYDEAQRFDAQFGIEGLHAVAAKIGAPERQTILPPELFHRFENDSFWQDPAFAARGVTVI